MNRIEYQYPIDLDWSNEEMMRVVSFFNAIEAYYEDQVERETLMERYRQFKRIVPGKAEEKQTFKSFEKASGYSSYHAVKDAQNHPDQKMIGKNLK
ncbi:uncharacterized protein YktA (UPF0223 family) [Staphylococcus auricularis]|nr:UPF0223 family protein [Staphylococcus auricularis]BCU52017.1 UPF0223 protein [Staphylococcus auricularis]SQJ10070.1 Putative cytosolic protein [Staphylococcus auricularis]